MEEGHIHQWARMFWLQLKNLCDHTVWDLGTCLEDCNHHSVLIYCRSNLWILNWAPVNPAPFRLSPIIWTSPYQSCYCLSWIQWFLYTARPLSLCQVWNQEEILSATKDLCSVLNGGFFLQFQGLSLYCAPKHIVIPSLRMSSLLIWIHCTLKAGSPFYLHFKNLKIRLAYSWTLGEI